MPRKSRIDAPGALQHVIGRGLHRTKIFRDDTDRRRFLTRLSDVLSGTDTRCLAWALIPNHFHLLLKSGVTSVSTLMRRLLTGYAMGFNRRHRRRGHLFQNRFNSVLCQEERYLLELVRYIHLNPLRARLIDNLRALDRYPFCGHAALMGYQPNNWQDCRYVLKLFDRQTRSARRAYRGFVSKGIAAGRRAQLTSGGLTRTAWGWKPLTEKPRSTRSSKTDERIMGDSAFVKSILQRADEALERKYAFQAAGIDLDGVVEKVAAALDLAPAEVMARGKYRQTVQARSLLCFWAVRELGMTMASLSRKLELSETTISKSVFRGEQIAKTLGIRLQHSA